VALLDNPAAGSTVAQTTLDSQGYIDVSYSAVVGVGVNTYTITTEGPQFTFSGTGKGTAAVKGFGTSLGGDVFQYAFTGSFVPGLVTMNFIAGSFEDNAGNFNKASSLSFTVVPGISVGNASQTRLTKGTVNELFTVLLSAPSSTAVTVHYATQNGTAVAGTDYTAESGVLTFPKNVTTETISVPILASSTTTTSKTFLLNLSTPSGAVITQASATGTILPAKTAAPVVKAVLSSPAAVTTGPSVPSSLAAAVAAIQTSSNSNQQKTTTAVDAVFATLFNGEQW
jgi:hypothetical protein